MPALLSTCPLACLFTSVALTHMHMVAAGQSCACGGYWLSTPSRHQRLRIASRRHAHTTGVAAPASSLSECGCLAPPPHLVCFGCSVSSQAAAYHPLPSMALLQIPRQSFVSFFQGFSLPSLSRPHPPLSQTLPGTCPCAGAASSRWRLSREQQGARQNPTLSPENLRCQGHS